MRGRDGGGNTHISGTSIGLFWPPVFVKNKVEKIAKSLSKYDAFCFYKRLVFVLQILNSTDAIELDTYEANGAWDMLETRASREVCTSGIRVELEARIQKEYGQGRI